MLLQCRTICNVIQVPHLSGGFHQWAFLFGPALLPTTVRKNHPPHGQKTCIKISIVVTISAACVFLLFLTCDLYHEFPLSTSLTFHRPTTKCIKELHNTSWYFFQLLFLVTFAIHEVFLCTSLTFNNPTSTCASRSNSSG